MRSKLLCTILAACALLVFSPAISHAAGGGGGHGGGGEVPVGPAYVELDPLLLPIIDDTGISQQVSLIVKIEVKDASKIEEIKSIMPRIVDAFVQDMYGSLGDNTAFMTNGILRLDKVKARLKETALKMVEGDTITDVLLQVVQQHKV